MIDGVLRKQEHFQLAFRPVQIRFENLDLFLGELPDFRIRILQQGTVVFYVLPNGFVFSGRSG